MTAPLVNLPIANPVAGSTASGPSAQGAAGGFEALMAAFFGGQAAQGQAATPGPFGAGKTDRDIEAQATDAQADETVTPPGAEGMMLAAMLAPAPQVQAQPTAAPESEAGARAAAAPPVLAAASGEPTATAEPVAAASEGEAAAEATPQKPAVSAELNQAVKIPDAVRPQVAANAIPPRPLTEPAQPVPPPVVAASAVAAEDVALSEAAPVEPRATKAARNGDGARKVPVHAAPAAANLEAAAEPALANAVAPVSDAEPAALDAGARVEADPLAARTANKADADAPEVQGAASAPPAALAAQIHASPNSAVRGSPETVANLAAQIVKKLDGRSTKFDVELNPIGLGQVNVSVEIAANGRMTAAMTFDNAHAAAELRSRSHDLQRALEQAGFDVSGGMSFDVATDRGDGRQAGAQHQQQQAEGAWRGRAFQAVLGTAGEAADTALASALNPQRRSNAGVDIRI